MKRRIISIPKNDFHTEHRFMESIAHNNKTEEFFPIWSWHERRVVCVIHRDCGHTVERLFVMWLLYVQGRK